MKNDLPKGVDPKVLETCSRETLLAIIYQQQKQIIQLQQEQHHPVDADLFSKQTHSAESPLATEENLLLQPHLQVRTESGQYVLSLANRSFWTIGRSADNDIVLPDRWMSRNHAMLQCMAVGEFYLIDFGSHNGSFVNGRRVSVPLVLKHGDLLTFGQTNIDFLVPTLPEPVASPEQPTSGATVPDDGPVTALLHLRRLISVLVVGIRNFTGLTRSLDERLLSEVVGTWFRRAGEIIRENGSWVDKYIGDAVMAVWIHGAQEISSDEICRPFNALHALHQMTSQLHLSYPLPFPLRIGAGINTGFAMVGNTGSGERPDYTALGDTVNAAFRLETSTKQLGVDIAVGLTTYQYLLPQANEAALFQPHDVQLKGYEGPATIYAGSFEDLSIFLQKTTSRG